MEELGDGGGAAGLVPLQRLSRGVLAPPQRLPRGLGSAGASPGKKGAGKAGGVSRLGSTGGWPLSTCPGRENAPFVCGTGPGQVGFVAQRRSRGAWEQPQICPFWGGSTPHTPVLGWNPGRAARMCLGQEEEGVGGRTERTEPSHGGKSRILENPFWVCFSKLSLFPTHFFFFFSGATSSGATTKPSSVPRVPAVLPPRSRPAELRRFSFFPIIIIIIISNAGCNKKNQLFPPKEASVVPPGPCPSVHDLPTERLHSHGTGSLAKKTAGKNQDPRKKEKHLPRSSGSRGGQWESKGENPAGSPPKNAKGITESPQSKVSDSPGRMGVFRDSGGK